MIEFNSKEELKNRVLPALQSKKDELRRWNIEVTTDNIWDYLALNIFPNIKGLTLYDIVHEIMNVDILKLKKYLKDKEL